MEEMSGSSDAMRPDREGTCRFGAISGLQLQARGVCILEKLKMEKLKNINELYSDYYIKKRKNKYRHIQAPNENLKQKQYNVLRQLEDLNLPIHECAYGFVKDKSIADNARVHVGQECILNLDLKDVVDCLNTLFVIFSIILDNSLLSIEVLYLFHSTNTSISTSM